MSATLPCQKHTSSKLRTFRAFTFSIVRIVCLDVPLFFVLILIAIISHTEWIGDNYLIPLIELQRFDYPEQALTYYHRVCTEEDQTTYDTDDLLVDISYDKKTKDSVHNVTTDRIHQQNKINRAMETMLYHGVTILPNLISESTATALRDYIIQQNTNIYRDDIIEVIENDFRYSFGIRVDEHPIIATALEEILLRRNPTLVSYLEAIMGPDPAVTEFTAISQEYGAVDQRWHHDGTLK
jgi:hypothetical protein